MIKILCPLHAPLALPLARRLQARLNWAGQNASIALLTSPAPGAANHWQIAVGDFPDLHAWQQQSVYQQHFSALDWSAIAAFCEQHFPLPYPIYTYLHPYSDKGEMVLPGEYWLDSPSADSFDLQGAAPEWALVQALLRSKQRVAFAESCTGGLLAERFSAIPGASGCFDCGLVTYSNQQKMALLRVRRETLLQYGAVSPQTAEEMALAMLEHGDMAVAITGIAGSMTERI